MKPVIMGETIELHIDRLSYNGGRGVGRYNNYVIFVDKTAPEELIRARISSVKKNYAEAELVEILKASPYRRVAACPVADQCGGCVWQHLEYDEQVRQKKNFILYELRQILTSDLIEKLQVVASPKEFRYRNRVQVQTKNQQYGFFAAKSHRLVPIKDCLISDEKLFADLDFKSNVNFQSGAAGKFELSLKNGKREIRDLDKQESEFTQVNSAVNALMIKYVSETILQQKTSVSKNPENKFQIYDLYCGDGNLTFPLAEQFSDWAAFTGVEFSPSAIARAQKKLGSISSSTFTTPPHFFAQDVALFLKRQKNTDAEIFILDPPRAGLSSDTLSHIIRLGPSVLVYISCNLSSLKRDLDVLKTAYRVVDVRGFDMFPQTEFVETVVTLAKN